MTYSPRDELVYVVRAGESRTYFEDRLDAVNFLLEQVEEGEGIATMYRRLREATPFVPSGGTAPTVYRPTYTDWNAINTETQLRDYAPALRHRCDYCRAKVGDPCRSSGGSVPTKPHADRLHKAEGPILLRSVAPEPVPAWERMAALLGEGPLSVQVIADRLGISKGTVRMNVARHRNLFAFDGEGLVSLVTESADEDR